MKGSIFLLLAAVALSKGASLSWSDCLNKETVNILVSHENCNKFYQCDDGKLIPRTCPAKLVFNVDDQRCDWPENVDCQNRDISEDSDENEPESGTGGGNNDPSEAPAICAEEDSDGILIAHEYCNKYYICNDGRPVAMSCPADLFFNADIDQCDWPKNVECDRGVAPQPQPDGDGDNDNVIVVPELEPQPELEPENGDGDDNEPVGSGNGDPSEAYEICAAEDSDGILVAHEYCNKFYICSEGKPVARPCPAGLFFNANKDQCDWPENVDCDREIAPQPQPEEDGDNDNVIVVPELEPQPESEPENGDGDDNEPVGSGNGDPSEAPEICAAEDSDGILIAHEYCNKFYICSEGKPVARPCPEGLFFNANKDQCDWPENVDCDREIAPQPQPEEDGDNDNVIVVPELEPQPESEPENGDGDDNEPVGSGNGDPSEAPEICAAEDSDGILIAHEYCNKYYICSEGKPVARPCPAGLFFNANKDQCDWPENVDCDREIAPQPQPEEDGDNDNVIVVPELEPQPESEPENGDGDDNEPVGSGNGDPSEAPEICAAEDSDGILIAHEYCNKYYICSVGKPVARPCPAGLFFNANNDQCDWPENVDCDREIAPQPQPEGDGDNDNVIVVPELEPQPESEPENGDGDDNEPVGSGNGDPSEAPEICAAEDSDGILIAHEYCNKFYICSEGKPVARPCPAGLFFNANKDQCDWPENVDCDREIAPQPQPEEDGDNDNVIVVPELEPQPESEPENGDGNDNEPVGSGNGDPSEAPEICAAEDSDGILIAHEYCNKYYICSEGKPVARPCPAGLFFNANKDQCDWPENVDCDREIAPQPQPEEDGDNDNVIVVPELEPQPESEPENGDGDDNEPAGSGNGDPSEAPEICAAEDSDGILIAHEYCNKYYICSEGKPVARPCPAGLFFNANKDQCDWPENVDCDREIAPQPQPEEDGDNDNVIVVPELEPQPESEPENGDGNDNEPAGSGNGDPSEAPEICAAEDSDGILIAHEYCNKYYICSEGKPVARPCPAGLFFNSNKDQCDWPENVDCDREIAPQPQPEEDGDNDNVIVVPELEPQPESEPENGDGDDNEPVGSGNGDPSEAPEICAAEDSDGILIAHEYCNKYYICSEGKPVARPCPAGLFFNANKDQCDWPENVDCDREIAPQPQPEEDGDNDNVIVVPELEPQPESEPENGDGDDNEPAGSGNGDPSEAPEICAAEDSDGILIAHEYCNKYYICSEGKPVARPCPAGLFFNANKDQCDWPENVDCDREIAPQPQPEEDGDNDNVIVVPELEPQPESEPENGDGDDNEPAGSGNGDPSEAPEICAAADSDGILIAHEYCNKFYICSEGKPVALTCPKQLFFNANNNQCDWPENVECDRGVAPQPKPDEDDDNIDEVVVPEPEAEPDTGDENQGNNYNDAATICAGEGSNGVLVAHEHCNQFYICSDGESVVLTCPPGLFFNADKNQCDWVEKVECDREVAPQPQPDEDGDNDNVIVVPEPEPQPDGGDEENNAPIGNGNSDPSQAETICAANESDGVLVAHENCNQFYICNQGNPLVLYCPRNLLFNPDTDQCDWPENVNCNGIVVDQLENNDNADEENINEGNNDPSLAPSLCAVDDSDGVLVAHENCNQFYVCSGSNPVALTCPQDLMYNPANDQCDWSDKVDCGNRRLPVGSF